MIVQQAKSVFLSQAQLNLCQATNCRSFPTDPNKNTVNKLRFWKKNKTTQAGVPVTSQP